MSRKHHVSAVARALGADRKRTTSPLTAEAYIGSGVYRVTFIPSLSAFVHARDGGGIIRIPADAEWTTCSAATRNGGMFATATIARMTRAQAGPPRFSSWLDMMERHPNILALSAEDRDALKASLKAYFATQR